MAEGSTIMVDLMMLSDITEFIRGGIAEGKILGELSLIGSQPYFSKQGIRTGFTLELDLFMTVGIM